ncbi:MAG: hypothetical protein MZV70_17575 [Desulfobacterales bacterium]|nr:hypothetical protein [Desulfobacterales bacterium]
MIGYRYQVRQGNGWQPTSDSDSKMAISTADLPTKTEMQSIIGESSFHDLYGLKDERLNKVDFYLAALMMEKIFHG